MATDGRERIPDRRQTVTPDRRRGLSARPEVWSLSRGTRRDNFKQKWSVLECVAGSSHTDGDGAARYQSEILESAGGDVRGHDGVGEDMCGNIMGRRLPVE